MILMLLAVAPASPPRLLPDRFESMVEAPWGRATKRTLYGLCFAQTTRIGRVVAQESFLQEFTRESGEVYSKRPYTRVTLETEAELRGEPGQSFQLIVEGGTINRIDFPVPPEFGNTEVGAKYLVGYNPIVSPKHVHHPWPQGSPVVAAVVFLRKELDLDRAGFDALCESVDFTTP